MNPTFRPIALALFSCSFALSLAGCGAGQPSAAPASSAPTLSTPDRASQASTASPAEERRSGLILSSPSDSGPSPHRGKPDVDASGAAVEDESSAAEERPQAFDPKRPMLGRIALGMNEAQVSGLLGSPAQAYELPQDEGSIEIREYAGINVGFDENGNVVYVELASDAAESGLKDLEVGGDGERAARLLDVPYAEDDRVLTLDVQGGLLKLDLDPSSRTILSIKLIGDRS